jgi:hypothetical protein
LSLQAGLTVLQVEESYAGQASVIRKNGSRLNGRNHISKIVNQKQHNLLFMCSFNACKYNKACRDIYERIINKGKSKKLALNAVAYKLLKHCFAIAKSERSTQNRIVQLFQK